MYPQTPNLLSDTPSIHGRQTETLLMHPPKATMPFSPHERKAEPRDHPISHKRVRSPDKSQLLLPLSQLCRTRRGIAYRVGLKHPSDILDSYPALDPDIGHVNRESSRVWHREPRNHRSTRNHPPRLLLPPPGPVIATYPPSVSARHYKLLLRGFPVSQSCPTSELIPLLRFTSQLNTSSTRTIAYALP